jgi:predicted nucleotidyltransferase
MKTPAPNPSPTEAELPVGTQVVTRVEVRSAGGGSPKGAVGIILRAPTENTPVYRVRFPDGVEADYRREDLEIRKHFQLQGLQASATEESSLYDCVIYRCIVGSRAYGLDEATSDVDRRGFYLPPADLHWSLAGVPEQLENTATEECYWELRKFLWLALKANPNVLECLYSPLIEHATPLAQELLSQRHIFLSRLVYQTYNGYVLSQFKKLEGDIRNHGSIKWKHAMHLIRVLLSGITTLTEGYIPVDVGEHRERLLAIRRGEAPWEEINAWRISLHRQFNQAFERTTLPERPDYEAADRFLIRARRSRVEEREETDW